MNTINFENMCAEDMSRLIETSVKIGTNIILSGSDENVLRRIMGQMYDMIADKSQVRYIESGDILEDDARYSEHWVFIEDLQSKEDFVHALRVMLSGHSVVVSFRASDSQNAFRRMVTNCTSESTFSEITHLTSSLADNIGLVLHSNRVFKEAHVTEISTIDKDGATLNKVFGFQIDDIDNDHNVTASFKKYSAIGSSLSRRLRLGGVDEDFVRYLETI